MSGERELPDGWVWTTLGNVADTTLGKMLDKTKSLNAELVPYLRNSNVQWGRIDLDDVKQMRIPSGELDRFALTAGDLLVCEGGEIGRAAIWQGRTNYMAFQKALHRVRPTGATTATYLRYLLEYLADTGGFDKLSTGSTIKHLPQQQLRQLPIPLPPLAEQHRIVESLENHLSRLNSAANSLGSAQAKLKNFHRSIHTSALFGNLERVRAEAGPSRNHILSQRARLYSPSDKRGRPDPLSPRSWGPISFPNHWTVCSLEEVTHPTRTISYGILMPGPNQEQGVPYVRVVNMRGDRIDADHLHRTTPEIDEQYARARLAADDVLISIRGTYGRICLVPHTLDGANITQDTARLAFVDLIDPKFACIYLRSNLAQQYFRAVARGVAVKGVNIGDLRDMPFPVPSLAEQHAIVQHVDTLISDYEATVSATEHGIVREGRLRAAILRQAFAGKLVAQDPADEPASHLLVRIKAERANLLGARLPRRTGATSKMSSPKRTTIVPPGIQEELPL